MSPTTVSKCVQWDLGYTKRYVADIEATRLSTDCAASKWNISAGQVNARGRHWR